MQDLPGMSRCKCCYECTNDWRSLNDHVPVSGKNVLVHEMMKIFQLPEDFHVEEEDGMCGKCLAWLEFGYQFYETLLNAHEENRYSSVPITPPVPENIFKCGICDSSFATKLEREKHMKVLHPQPKHQSHHCQPCQKYFKTNRGMLQHNAMHHSESQESYRCHLCDRQFVTKTNYGNHMRYHKDYVCHFCNSGWMGESKLLEHVRTSHLDRLYVCRFCDKTECLKKCLNRHLRTAHRQEGELYYCGHCGSDSDSFDSYEMLANHLQIQHTEDDATGPEKESYDALLLRDDTLFTKGLPPLESNESDEIVREKEMFLQNFHLIRSSGNAQDTHETIPKAVEPRIDRRTVLEDFLDEAFENNEIWSKYIESGEEYLIDDYDFYLAPPAGCLPEQDTCTYRCPRCQRGFRKQLELTVHLAEEHDVECLVCNVCTASFKRLRDYRTHRSEHLKENVRFRESNIPEVEEALSLVQSAPHEYSIHEEEMGYRFTCNLCDRTFYRKHNLEKHSCRFYENHDREKVIHQCTHCPYRTLSARELDTHQRTHQPPEQEIIYCMLCDRRFTSTSGLKYHLKRHEGTKAFTCLYCGKKFTASSNLNAHIRNVHSERKAHRCDDCGETYATKDHLNKHQRSRHRKERSFVCGECGKGYFQRSHLNEHVAASHREDRYLCSFCNGSYVCKSSLKRHQQQKHADER